MTSFYICNNCNVTDSVLPLLTLFIHRYILYEAFKRPEQFVGHAGSILLNAEISTYLHGLEVRSEAAVVPTSDRNVLAVKDMRIALASRLGHGLDEREVLVVTEFLTNLVASQDSLIVLTSLHLAVAAKQSFQIHAQMRVRVPTLLYRAFCSNDIFHNCQY